MFFIRVISVAEIVIDANCLHDARDCFGAQGGNASRHHGGTGCKVLAQLIVERCPLASIS
jgi:hypothetical protein